MVAAIIQARMGSTRLPGKVLKELNGKPLLENIINRLKYCKRVDKIIVATTNNKVDNDLEIWCKERNIQCFRGDENNVLNRYYEAAKAAKADVIVRITADDPFKDPLVIDAVIEQLLTENLDFSFNNYPPSYPEGLDTEVFTFEAIEKAINAETSDFEKEHVTQYFYHNPSLFKLKNFSYNTDISNFRLTVDTDKDFELAETIYSKLAVNDAMFYLEDILKLFNENPELVNINKDVKRSAMYVKNN